MAAITLTIDNGPHAEHTPEVLDVLKALDLQAYFFIVGQEAEKPGGMALLDRVREEGHIIGNHSWTHGTPLGEETRPGAAAEEVHKTHELLAPYLTTPPLFRPFGGGGKLGKLLLSPEAVEALVSHQYTCVLWNSVPGDWLTDAWVDVALQQVGELDEAAVVLHDFVPGNATRIREFVERASEAGHTFVSTLPTCCLPMVGGEARPGLDRFVADQRW